VNGGIRKLDFALVEHAGCVNVLKPILKITLLFILGLSSS
jgi:hypothetical protein